MKKKPLLLCLFCIFFSTTTCSFFQGKNSSMEYLLPSETDFPGWVKSDAPVTLKGRSLRSYKKEYAEAGAGAYTLCRYYSLNDREIYIDLKIIKFDTTLNAYGFFSDYAGFREWISHDFTDEYRDDSVYIRRKGDYVIIAEKGEPGLFLRSELMTLVKTADQLLENHFRMDKLPPVISLLKNQSGNNVIFRTKGTDLFRGIDNLYYSRIDKEGQACYIFISIRRSFTEAFRLYRAIVENEKYIAIEALTRHSAFFKAGEKNYRFISINGNIITGLWGCSDLTTGEAILTGLNHWTEDRGGKK